jgi:hypothetical protein
VARLDQLNDLGTESGEATFTVESGQDRFGCLIEVAGMGGGLGPLVKKGLFRL